MKRFVLNDTVPTETYKNIDFNVFMKDHPIVTNNKGKVLLTTQPIKPIQPALGNGFIGALYSAYSYHHELVLRPDDVWLAISAAFANYVDSHSQEMRSLFVEHKDKITLKALERGNITTTNWNSLIEQLSEGIQKFTKDDVREWLEPHFTTTTSKDILIGRSILMGAMKNYFAFECYLRCNIPSVVLMGVLDDWKLVRQKVEKLAIYGKQFPDLLSWYSLLVPVIEQFIESYSGKVDKDFWNRICHESGGGSGPTYLSGWCLVFTPFLEGKFFLNKDPKSVKKKVTENVKHQRFQSQQSKCQFM